MKETQPASGGLRLLSFMGMGIGFAMAVVLRIVLAARQLPADLPIEWACPVLSSTGLLCMGCGATRALRSLLEGNLATAMRQNLLFVALLAALPLRLLPLRLLPLRLLPLRRLSMPLRRQPVSLAGWILLAIAIAFMIVRNLDGPLPALLRP